MQARTGIGGRGHLSKGLGQKKDSDALTTTGDRVLGDSAGSRDKEGKPTGFLR